MKALLLFVLLAVPARAYVLIDGPMPLLAPKAPAAPSNTTPAPRANPDVTAPSTHTTGAVIKPSLINRSSTAGTSNSGANAFSEDLARRNRSSPIGTTLAPGIVITQPLQ